MLHQEAPTPSGIHPKKLGPWRFVTNVIRAGGKMRKITAGIISIALLGMTGLASAQDLPPLGFKKPLSDDTSTSHSPDETPGVEAYLLRAYPATEISGDSTLGPSKASYPAFLDQFLFDGAGYVASGRVTAMAISPTCNQGHCLLYVAAAGGGVWKTDKALNGANWQFISGSFGTNAIGSLLMDPSDSSGNTLYAGTGEPNASGDSEAGVGIYKTTDG